MTLQLIIITVSLVVNTVLLFFLLNRTKLDKEKEFIINKTRIVSREMYELGNREEFIKDICDTVKSITSSDEFVYFSYDPLDQSLLPEYTDGPYKEQLKRSKLKIGEGFSGYVAKERKGMFMNEANKSSLAKHVPGTPDEQSSLLAIPIIFSGELLGVILQTKLNGKHFTQNEFHLSEIFVNLASAFIAGEKYVSKIKEGFIETLKLLISTVELKDTYTAGHSVRVSKISELIAIEMGCPENTIVTSKIGGLLHDVGKIGIKEELLRKKKVLDEVETDEIRKHSILGAELIAQFRMFNSVVESIRHHHEWYNGTGYPDGLAGENIPITSRIILVADAIDAMTSGRPGRKINTIEETYEELRKFSVIQFDPKVVETCFKIKDKISEVIKSGVKGDEFATENDFNKIAV